jgi:flagellum-specific peptidoglycan hydrolase FlgJ
MKLKTFLLTGMLLLGTIATKAQEKQVQIGSNTEQSITKESLYEQIKKYGIKFPDVVFAQAILESGQFTSMLFKSANNLFGMKIPTKRESSANGKTKSGYSSYEDWNFSVYDYFLWQDYMLRNKGDLTKNQYLALLGKVYAEDPQYVNKLKRRISEYNHIFSTN